MKLRIHHFYDIIRSFGRREKLEPHHYQHSYHKVAKAIWKNPCLKIKITTQCDDVCDGCVHCKNNSCDDIISHRKDFRSKEKFNNFLDQRIMKVCLINRGDTFTPIQLCKKAKLYLQNIDWIYKGNDLDHTKLRKKSVASGLEYYSKKHKFDIGIARNVK